MSFPGPSDVYIYHSLSTGVGNLFFVSVRWEVEKRETRVSETDRRVWEGVDEDRRKSRRLKISMLKSTAIGSTRSKMLRRCGLNEKHWETFLIRLCKLLIVNLVLKVSNGLRMFSSLTFHRFPFAEL